MVGTGPTIPATRQRLGNWPAREFESCRWVCCEGIFAELRDPDLFAQVTVDPEAETIVWPNDADVDPDTLYEEARRTVTRD